MWLSILCPSCRPSDLNKWLDSLYEKAVEPLEIQLSLTLESPLDERHYDRWGGIVITTVKHGEYNINQLVEICYKQSSCPYIFLSGDDSICETQDWDKIFKHFIKRYPDNVVLVFPNDTIFGPHLACYPVTSRLVMDHVDWPVPYVRYAIDDTIFDIVPPERRIYLPGVTMVHLHKNDDGSYPIDQRLMAIDRPLYNKLQPERDVTRDKLRGYIHTATR